MGWAWRLVFERDKMVVFFSYCFSDGFTVDAKQSSDFTLWKAVLIELFNLKPSVLFYHFCLLIKRQHNQIFQLPLLVNYKVGIFKSVILWNFQSVLTLGKENSTLSNSEGHKIGDKKESCENLVLISWLKSWLCGRNSLPKQKAFRSCPIPCMAEPNFGTPSYKLMPISTISVSWLT